MKKMRSRKYPWIRTALLCGAAAVLSLFSACKGSGETESTATPLVGGDRDEHGCIASAGYRWSRVQQRCIRPFEEGVRLLPVEDPQDSSAVLAATVIFSTDSLRAEVLLPDGETSPVLDRRTLPSGGYAWNIEDDDTYNVRRDEQGKWTVSRRGKVLFRAE